jgi:hypothetical protein
VVEAMMALVLADQKLHRAQCGASVAATPPQRHSASCFDVACHLYFNFLDRQIVGILAELIKRDPLSDTQIGAMTACVRAVLYCVIHCTIC